MIPRHFWSWRANGSYVWLVRRRSGQHEFIVCSLQGHLQRCWAYGWRLYYESWAKG